MTPSNKAVVTVLSPKLSNRGRSEKDDKLLINSAKEKVVLRGMEKSRKKSRLIIGKTGLLV